MHASLSSCSGMIGTGSSRSKNSFRIQMASLTARAKATYSASAVEVAVIFCLVDSQDMGSAATHEDVAGRGSPGVRAAGIVCVDKPGDVEIGGRTFAVE